MKHDSIIWPSEVDVIERNNTFFYKNNKVPLLLGKIIKYGRISSITMCIIYYLTYNFIIPNLAMIEKQRVLFNLQALLHTRQLLQNIKQKIQDIEDKKTEFYARRMVQLEKINSLVKRTGCKKSSITSGANDLGADVTSLINAVSKEIEGNDASTKEYKKSLSNKAKAFKETIDQLKISL